ncbi:Ca-activated chloride channel family protein [Methanomicrobium sp. W14]|uniref:vWA domain-containing protein n=1 Tax=Methanomicrobium sp. W14 TaxID=2817839 RepID=UPI001AE6577A|nr:VWA domain-containing protein [Methanomicrobium sp. W14]MBP2132782.1 Ca-activated chloride channel family protein [Methanomicrobium sp. W14]
MAGFYHPLWLLGLLTLPVLWYYYQYSLKKRKQSAMAFSRVAILKTALGDSKKSKRPMNLFILALLALGLLFVGLADPHIPLEQTKEGVNVVLVIDDSGSMQATDYQPTRLEAAKSAAKQLINSLDPKDYCGIVVFESGATTAAYLSPDKDGVIGKLENIEAKNGQTALGDGLSLGIDMADSIPNRKKVVVLLSDGVSNAGVISPEEAEQFAEDSGIQVFTVGMGSTEPVVLGYDWFGNPQYAQLDEDTLKEIAENTGGKYFRSVNGQTLSDIYSNLNSEIKREKEETSIGWVFIVLSIISMFAEIYFRYGARRIIQ